MKKILFLFFLLLFSAGAAQTATVRVLLAEKVKTDTVKNSGLVYIYEKGSKKKFKVSAPSALEIKALGGGKIKVGTLESAKNIIIDPAKNTKLTFRKNVYAGALVIVPAGNTFHVVEYVDIEPYLHGVLPYEMSASWPVEALKAQAVAARTYTLKTLENTKNKNFDLYNDIRSQMYKGVGKTYPNVTKAVDETKGEVLTYDGKLFYTFYHANCGGGTDDVKHWNSASFSIKPLQGAKCNSCDHSKNYAWTVSIPKTSIQAFTKKNKLEGEIKSIKISKKTNTGRAVELQFKTSKGVKILSCAKFRMAVGSTKLKSCKITDINGGKTAFTFKGKGYGHGSGLCQDGANGMAKAGKNYKQILNNYYPSSKLTKL